MLLPETMIVWTPKNWGEICPGTAGQMRAIPYPDTAGISDAYAMSNGACWRHWRAATRTRRLADLLMIAWTAVLRDGLDPQVVHVALSDIEEYDDALPMDLPARPLFDADRAPTLPKAPAEGR